MKNLSSSGVKYPIFIKIVIFIAIPLILVYGFTLLLSYNLSKNRAIRETKEYLKELTGHHSAEIDHMFYSVAYEAVGMADLLASMSNMGQYEKEMTEMIENKIRDNKNLAGMSIVFEPGNDPLRKKLRSVYFYRQDGNIIAVGIDEGLFNYSEDWYEIPKIMGQPYWTEPYLSDNTDHGTRVTYAYPLKINDKFIGITSADLSLKELSDKISNISIMQGYIFLVSKSGTFIFHPNESFILNESIFSLAQQYNLPHYRDTGKDMVSGGSGITEYYDYMTGERKWIVYAPISTSQWSFAAVIPESGLLSDLRSALMYQSLIMLFGLIIIIMIIVFASCRIVQPIKKLCTSAGIISQGDLDQTIINFKSSDEIGELTYLFNKMSKDLREYINRVILTTREKESAESEFRIARQIQESLLPRRFPPFPDIRGLDVFAINIPSRVVGGDYYDFLRIDKNRVFIVLSDVSGKGVSACFYMALFKGILMGIIRKETKLEDIINSINSYLYKNTPKDIFVTAICGFLDMDRMTFSFVRAGHCPLLHYSQTKKAFQILKPKGTVLGALKDIKGLFDSEAIMIGKNDLLFIYSDGVSEAMNEDKSMYGEENMQRIIGNESNKNIRHIINDILESIYAFRGSCMQSDDIAIAGIKIIDFE